MIYNSENLTPSNVLQSLVFDGSCGETLQLKNRFGASEVVGFTVGGNTTSAFFNASIEFDISVPRTSPATQLESLFVESSEGSFNLTQQVSGTVVDPGQSETTSFSLTLDVTNSRNVLFLSTVTAQNANGPITGLECTAESFLSFPVGTTDDVSQGNIQNSSIVTINHGVVTGPF